MRQWVIEWVGSEERKEKWKGVWDSGAVERRGRKLSPNDQIM